MSTIYKTTGQLIKDPDGDLMLRTEVKEIIESLISQTIIYLDEFKNGTHTSEQQINALHASVRMMLS